MKKRKTTGLCEKVLLKSKNYTNEVHHNEEEKCAGTSKQLRKATPADKERKREKSRLNRQIKRKLKSKKQPSFNEPEAKKLALDYLHLWESSIDQWSFKKKRQHWLLNNIYNANNVSDKDFETLLNHILGLQGCARKRLLSEAEKIIKDFEIKVSKQTEEIQDTKEGETESDNSPITFERARNILQTLV